MGDAPQEYIDPLLKATVGLEIKITRLVGKAKLSQNKEPRDTRNAGEMLNAQGDQRVGQAMFAAAARKSEQG